jgi:hypothetical protein
VWRELEAPDDARMKAWARQRLVKVKDTGNTIIAMFDNGDCLAAPTLGECLYFYAKARMDGERDE